MSTVIMSQCWPLQGMTPVQKSVLISLADQANDDGVCWPAVATIASRTCVSERSVQAALRWLEENGFISAHRRAGRSTWYTVTPANAAPRSSCTPANAAPPPPQMPHPTPADAAPITVKEPSGEPSVVTGAPEASESKRPSKRITVRDLLRDNPHNVSEQTLADWLAARQQMRAPVTATVWRRVNDELAKCVAAGLCADDCLAEAQAAGWRGFKHEWLLNRQQRNGAQARSAGPDFNDTSWADELGDDL